MELDHLPSGVPGLDEVLGGGIPERSFTVIAGGSGSGKTTLALQFAFANASPEYPALYFCGQGEPPDKLRINQLRQTFFDDRRLDDDVQIVALGPHASEREAGRAIDLIRHAIETELPGVIVVDAPQSLMPAAAWTELALLLANSNASTLLVGETNIPDAVLAAADSVIRLDGRTVRAAKARGRDPLGGHHSVRISERGMRVFPRWPTPQMRVPQCASDRVSTGVDEVDRLLGGGVLSGSAVLVEGPSGTGKSVLATQFVAEAGHRGTPGLIVVCEERPERWVARGEQLGFQLDRLVQTGLLEVLSFRGRDLYADEFTYLVQRAAIGMRAQNLVIDSTVGLNLLLRQADLRDCLWRMTDALSATGTTVWVNAAPGEWDLRGLFDDVLELSRIAYEGRSALQLNVIKASAPVRIASGLVYQVGSRGIEPADLRPSNGHIVNYRIAG